MVRLARFESSTWLRPIRVGSVVEQKHPEGDLLKHVQQIQSEGVELPDSFLIKATGRFYTHEQVARNMVRTAISAWRSRRRPKESVLRVVDPFAGDGRLIVELLTEWSKASLPPVRWEVELWDLNKEGLATARKALTRLKKSGQLDLSFRTRTGDAFRFAENRHGYFHFVITNPPWELLKPDRRDLQNLAPALSEAYIAAMRGYDTFLAEAYPLSQPARKFAGWGTNLSRVGFDLCQKLLSQNSMLAIVMPASFMADDVSIALRREVIERSRLHEISYYPAEAKLFGTADVATITMVMEPARPNGSPPTLIRFDKNLDLVSQRRLHLDPTFLKETGFVVPVSVGGDAIAVLQKLSKELPAWAELEGDSKFGLWAGRELDETGSRSWLSEKGDGPLFIKGRMVNRFLMSEEPSLRVRKTRRIIPASVNQMRLVWRDVSRPNQKRRVIATLIPSGYVTGNSLGVAYFRDGASQALQTLLGIMSSLVFEFQLRSHLATGHISLSSLRKVRVPDRRTMDGLVSIQSEVEKLLADPTRRQARLEALVAWQAYALESVEFTAILKSFPKLSADEREEIMEQFAEVAKDRKMAATDYGGLPPSDAGRIANHLTARLSELDMRMVRAVPQGGNWKDIPESIPSRRLEQIRESFKRGEGSRSTYYGRLRPNMPSHTISTYFNRPGNGCHIHYEQDRVLSQREAARLQSFPDAFEFLGPQGVVNKQIGNAVPPLLAYQIALQLGPPGMFVDLFCGAGGMGLGFKWAGWTPIVGNDIEKRFLETYSTNVHREIVLGSISDRSIQQRIADIACAARRANPSAPFWVLGGPPCQGFSTAGHRRTMDDKRNHLFWDYTQVLDELQPDGFVFENVPGLLNMQGGKIFEVVKDAFAAVMPKVEGWLLSADDYAIPQRRKRVILVGTKRSDQAITKPPQITSCGANGELFSENHPAVAVSEALSDLPPLTSGQDGCKLAYQGLPQSTYQALMRGLLSPAEYLESIRREERSIGQ